MNVSINFPGEIESQLLRRAASSGRDIADIVREFVSERLAEDVPMAQAVGGHEDFMSKLRAIIAAHPTSNGDIDDSRESIYAGRGE